MRRRLGFFPFSFDVLLLVSDSVDDDFGVASFPASFDTSEFELILKGSM